MLPSVKNCFCNALDYQSDCLANKSSKFDDPVALRAARWTNGLQIQMEKNILGSFGSISMIGFLSTLKFACDTNEDYESAAMWLLPSFMKKPAAAGLKSC